MDLKDIAAVSEKGGLYKVVKPTRTGVILESLDEKKKKLVANASSRVSILKEISIYTTGAESSIMLEEVFGRIHDEYGKELNIKPKSSKAELEDFISEVVPNYDPDKVYMSDVKKLISWYQRIAQFAPEVLEQESSDENESKNESSSTTTIKASKEKDSKEK